MAQLQDQEPINLQQEPQEQLAHQALEPLELVEQVQLDQAQQGQVDHIHHHLDTHMEDNNEII